MLSSIIPLPLPHTRYELVLGICIAAIGLNGCLLNEPDGSSNGGSGGGGGGGSGEGGGSGTPSSPPPGPSAEVAFEELLREMPEGGWRGLNRNSITDVTPPAELSPPPAPGSVAPIPRAWASFAWDSQREQLILWGGGHANSLHNEPYLFKLDSLEWVRGHLPTRTEFKSSEPPCFETADGYNHSPVSAHTYHGNQYLAELDRFVSFGGAKAGDGGTWRTHCPNDNAPVTGPYLWDPSKADADKVGGDTGSQVDPEGAGFGVEAARAWENRDWMGDPGYFSRNVNRSADYRVEDGQDVVYIAFHDLWRVEFGEDRSADVVRQHGTRGDGGVGNKGLGMIHDELDLFVRYGLQASQPRWVFWRLGNEHAGQPYEIFDVDFRDSVFPGDGWGRSINDYGLAYDPVRERGLMWAGRESVFEIIAPSDPGSSESWILRRVRGAEDDTSAAPEETPYPGVMGKWRYAADYDVFLGGLQNGDIWVYKPRDWDPAPGVAE